MGILSIGFLSICLPVYTSHVQHASAFKQETALYGALWADL